MYAAGAGLGGLLAYEAAMRMGETLGDSAVPCLMLLPEPLSCSIAEEVGQPWFRVWPIVVR